MRAGDAKAEELRRHLDMADTPEKRLRVLRSCVNLVTVSVPISVNIAHSGEPQSVIYIFSAGAKRTA
jgi:hypothetical protein